MNRFFKRRTAPQSAEGATADGPITMISEVRGNVTVVTGHHSEPPGAPEIEEACARYATRVRQRYGRLDLEVLTPLREQGEHPAVQLRDVFVPQSVRADPPPVELPQELLRRLMDPAEAELHDLPPGIDRETVERVRRAYQERPPRPVLDVLTAPGHDRVVILGHPGSGKSTLARYLALALTTPEPPPDLEPLHGRLPLIVELRSYAQAAWRDRSFEDFLVHQHETEGLGLPPAMLAAFLGGEGPHTSLVIFDGLDELFEKDVRDTVARRIAGFAARHPRARVVVTSRAYGYQRAVLDGAGFADFMLQDLNRAQIGAFAEQWFAIACPDDRDRARNLLERVTSAVDTSPSVRELAGNPLILTILAVIGRRRELPRDRRTVYEHAVDVLVEHWDPSKYLKDRRVDEHLPYLGAEDKRELLRLIARQMQEGHGGISGNHIAGPDLLKSFEEYLKDRYALPPDRAATAARIMLDQFRHRNFVLSRFGGEIYGFVHRTFLEYLAATDLAHRFNQQRELSEGDLQELFATKVHDPAWQEILLLLVGLLDERFVAGVIDRLLAPRAIRVPLRHRGDKAFTEVAFVARALAEVRRLGTLAPQSGAMVREVTRLLALSRPLEVSAFYPFQNVTSLGPSFAALGERWGGRDEYLEWYRSWYGGHAGGHAWSMPLNGPEHLAADIALFLIGSGGTSRSASVVEAATGSDSPLVRIAAVRHLLCHAADDPVSWDFTRRCLLDDNPGVRVGVLEHLTYNPVGAPETTTRLALDRLVHDDDPDVRQAAVECVPRQRLDAPGVRAGFDAALGDADPHVRSQALRWLVGNDEDPEAATEVLRAALRDEDPGIRAAALTAAEERAENDPVVRELLLDRVRNDESPRVKAAGCRALRPGDPTERTLLHDLCGHSHPEVRRSAIGCLADGGTMVEETREILTGLMRSDEDETVRAAAVVGLARRKDHDPALRGPILESVENDPSRDVQLRALQYLADAADGEARDALLHRATHDPDEQIRWTACYLLTAHYGDDADAMRHLLGIVSADDHVFVRAGVLRALGRRRGDRPEVLALAQDRLTRDADPEVRLVALRLLADGRRDDPEVLDLLRREAGTGTDGIRALARSLLAVLAPQES